MTWLRIIPALDQPYRWTVRTRENGTLLGRVYWYRPWRRYVVTLEPQTLLEEGCLRELAEFLEAETQQQRARWQANDATLVRAG